MRLPVLLPPRDLSALLAPPSSTALLLGPASSTALLPGPAPSTSSTRLFSTAHLVAHDPTPVLSLSPTTSFSPAPPPPSPVTGPPSTSAFPLPVSAPSSGLPEPLPTSPADATQWKVIGIGIITVGLIATVILSIIFFDSWWNFICDLLCGKNRRRSKGEENMVPDWEKRDWEFKLANEDGHRYPTMTSLTDIADHRQPASTLFREPDFDPRYLDPLSRRPSTRQD